MGIRKKDKVRMENITERGTSWFSSSTPIIGAVKQRTLRLGGHVYRMGETRKSYWIWVVSV